MPKNPADVADTQQQFPKFKPNQVEAVEGAAREYLKDCAAHQATTQQLTQSKQALKETMIEHKVPIYKFRKKLFAIADGEPELIVTNAAEPKKEGAGEKKGGAKKSMEETVAETEDER